MKRVLIISYYWPPSGGVSVLRSLKIAKYLRNFGWEPVVYVPKNAHYPYLDNSGAKDIPEDIEIIKGKIIEPFTVFKFLTGRKKEEPLNSIVQVRSKKAGWLDKLGIWIRGNFFIPDARSLWIKPSVKKLSRYLKSSPVDAIFSDGPPHTNTRIAYHLAKNLNIPWLADFQDPWTQADYYQMMLITSWGHRIHSKMEQQVFKAAQKITIASPSWKHDLESIGAKNVDVIYYGYDESDFSDLIRKSDKDTFDIVHIGLLGTDRDPRVFIEALSEISFPKKVRLVLAGQTDYEVLAHLQSQAKNFEVEDRGVIPRTQALQLALDADLLLLPLNKASNAKGRLPAKLYEYLRTYNPILGLGPIDSDAAKIIYDCESGRCIPYDAKSEIKDFLSGLIDDDVKIHPNKEKVSFFSNENQTLQVTRFLDEIIA